MNFKIESQRKKFITKYDIHMEKYTTNEITDQLEENISSSSVILIQILGWTSIIFGLVLETLLFFTH